MRIIFDLHDVGLGNNGGSRTIVKCAEHLAAIGHEIYLYSNIKNRYTWHTPKGVKFVEKCPAADAIIATGYRSVEHVASSKIPHKLNYIRGFELWQTTESKLIQSYKQLNCVVNSEWLYNLLSNRGIKSEIIYPGLDFDKFYITNAGRPIDVGAIYHRKHKTKNHVEAESVANRLGCRIEMLNRNIVNPKEDELRNWYNSIKIWVAPTELEGLHNPPMEAGLCGCALVCTNHPRSGMSDYAIDGGTAMLYNAGDLGHAADCVKKLLADADSREKLARNLIDLLKNKIGSRSHNMQKMVDYIKRL